MFDLHIDIHRKMHVHQVESFKGSKQDSIACYSEVLQVSHTEHTGLQEFSAVAESKTNM